MRYRAFMSYSHAADSKLAPALQSALQSFGKPFFKIRALKVFRDGTDLRLTPHLWPVIQEALGKSDYFILLASPDSAQSAWVQREIEEWLTAHQGDLSRFIIAVTDGTVAWNAQANNFDSSMTNALPPLLQSRFQYEPLYLDLRSVRRASDLSLRNPDFLDAVATIAATLYDKSKDDMVGAEIRVHRIFRAAVGAAITLLFALSAAAGYGFVTARREQARAEGAANKAIANQQAANRQRRLAMEATQAATAAAGRERVARERADRSRELANRQRDLAVESLTTLIFDAQDRLNEVPNSRLVRKSLLALAAKKLQQVDTSSKDVSAKVRYHGAVALSKLADNMRELGDYAEALHHYERSLLQFRALLAEKPDDLNRRMSVWLVVSKRGDMAAAESESELAERSYREALAIAEILARQYPRRDDLQRNLALSQGKMGDAWSRKAEIRERRIVLTGLKEAKAHWAHALTIYERLRTRQPEDTSLIHECWLATSRLGEIHRDLGDATAAELYIRKGHEIVSAYDSTALAPKHASDVAESMQDMAELAFRQGDLPSARAFAERALDLRALLQQYDREDYAAAVALVASLDHMGRIEEADKHYQQAMQHYNDARSLLQQLPIDDAEHYRGDLTLQLRDLSERLESCRKALAAVSPASAEQPR